MRELWDNFIKTFVSLITVGNKLWIKSFGSQFFLLYAIKRNNTRDFSKVFDQTCWATSVKFKLDELELDDAELLSFSFILSNTFLKK